MLGKGGYGLRSLLVEPAFARLSNMGSPDGVRLTDSTWGLYVTNNSCTNHWWGIEYCNITNYLLDSLLICRTLFNKSHDVRTSSFVCYETGKVWCLCLIIFRECLDMWS